MFGQQWTDTLVSGPTVLHSMDRSILIFMAGILSVCIVCARDSSQGVAAVDDRHVVVITFHDTRSDAIFDIDTDDVCD